MVDAAQAWDGPTAASRLSRLPPYGPAWVEEPPDRDDLPGQAVLRAVSPVPVAAGEGECGLGVASHSLTTGLNVLMHVHLLAALDTDDAWLEWPPGQFALWAELFPNAPRHVGGRVAVPEAPGWGMRPDPAVLRRLTVASMLMP